MGFKKGQSGNPGGRKPGALNKKTIAALQDSQRMRAMIEADPRFGPAMIAALTEKEMMQYWFESIEYKESKRARIEHEDREKGPRILKVMHFHQISAEQPKQLDNIIDITHTEHE